MNEEEIRSILDESFEIKGSVKINPNGVVDVNGDVESTVLFMDTGVLPVKFGTVTGSFKIILAYLKTLEGCPQIVGGDFNCTNNNIHDFTGGPTSVGGAFVGFRNSLSSLKGLPVQICKTATSEHPVSITWNENVGLLKLLTHDIGYANGKSPSLNLVGAPEDVSRIMNTHATRIAGGSGRKAAAIACSIELIRAGYRGNAKL